MNVIFLDCHPGREGAARDYGIIQGHRLLIIINFVGDNKIQKPLLCHDEELAQGDTATLRCK